MAARTSIALEGSLRRLRTDVIDLYWMHAWDMVTPVEEVLQSLGALQQSGKIRYFGFSDVPAWYAAKAATFAADHAVPGPIALQLEYSLVERSIEREHVPAARECGLGITPWSPLGGGFLAGKYARRRLAQTLLGKAITKQVVSAAATRSGTQSLPTGTGARWMPYGRLLLRLNALSRRLHSVGLRRRLALHPPFLVPANWNNYKTTSQHWKCG